MKVVQNLIVGSVSLLVVYLLMQMIFDDGKKRIQSPTILDHVIKNNKSVNVQVYSPNVPSARIWDTFGERRVTNMKTPLLELCRDTQNKHLGESVHIVTAKDLVLQMNGDEQKRSGIENGDEWAIENNTMLRDGLLLRMLSKTGGIVIPEHTIVMKDMRDLQWEQVSNMDLVLANGPSGPRKENKVDFGDTTGSRGFVFMGSRGGKRLREHADTIVNEACQREFIGGSVFWGGLRSYFQNLFSHDFKVGFIRGEMVGQRNGDGFWVSVSDLVGMTKIKMGGPMVVIPQPQLSGRNQVVQRDEWIQKASKREILESQTMISRLLKESLGEKKVEEQIMYETVVDNIKQTDGEQAESSVVKPDKFSDNFQDIVITNEDMDRL